MEKIRKYVFDNFDTLFILLILLSVILINFFIYAKVPFLHFYYLPVMVSAYYLGRRTAVLGAFLIILMIWTFILIDPESFMAWDGIFDHYFNLTFWGGFLILAAALVGTLSQNFRIELAHTKQLSEDLSQEQDQLKDANKKLEDYANELEEKVLERTGELESSHKVIESLKGKVEKALFSVMDATVARMMIEGKLRNEKRRISVLFSDLKEFTAYSDRNPPEQVVGELNSYLSAMEECITKYHGHIDKYMGDGIMVEFGAPVTFQKHSLMAVLAAVSMQNKIAETHPNWEMRIGIGTGTSVIGLFGSIRKSYSCIGDPANLASRLEGICIPGSVYIDEETYNDIQNYVHTEKVIDLFGHRASDEEGKENISALEDGVAKDPDNQEKLFALGKAYFKIRSASAAIDCFTRILKLNPDHTEAKLAYAEANIKLEEYEKISIKGKSRRVNVYKVLGLTDPLLNRGKIPASLYDKYGFVTENIKVPEDVILPVECLDGSLRHGRTVAFLAYALADKLELSAKEKENILIAGILHDFGKEIIPQEIIETPRKLTDSEFELVKKHSSESVKIIKKLGYQSQEMLDMVESHHEHYDGSGYPFGLKGESIPIGGRILSIVDTFDAMTSTRMYGETWEYRSAIREIKNEASNGAYDPEIVETFTKLLT